ncbi:phytoene/squalene synthase family protein [Stenotrophomonas sp. CFBP 13724]|uniref:squalene/phytoene synthase family protein n=1 Tax=Stenotrophomonas sp. CFBP 13724 TaxID=2775298 RepID=UPI001786CFF6|nr:phytoene/squalene synthase family protein [Stenotrophomonas sp. CFBP 13724]
MTDALERQARVTISRGSKSFAVASRVFDARTRRGATLLYTWCRHCDDVVDGQVLGHRGVPASASDPGAALAELRRCTALAYQQPLLQDPPFAALQEVVRTFAIPARHAQAHLDGFAMDVAGREYRTFDDTLEYCYHVAGVVGIMMCHIMGPTDPAVLDRAADLGLAFQLSNIARDVVEDAQAGRCYLPVDWLEQAGLNPRNHADQAHRQALAGVVARLLESAETYYASALKGLPALPARSAWAVATAHGIYREIGLHVRARGPAAWDHRVSTSTGDKLRLLLRGAYQARASRGEGVAAAQGRPAFLWQRPGRA